MPKISVIVPVYRAEAFLHKCVDGILSQTFSDFEVFLVDDGSPDGSGAICDSYLERDSRVRVIHQHNQGQAAARNYAIIQAQGEWVCFVDSDDLIHPQMLQRLYASAERNGAGISMCPMVEAPELPADFLDEPAAGEEVLPINEQTLCQLYDRDEYPSWVACAKLIRREYIADRPFCEGRVYEDNEAVCHWMHRTEKLVRLAAPMYYYRTNPGSTTQQGFTLKKLDYLWALESIICFYDSVGYLQMKQRFAARYTREVVNCGYGLRYDLQDPAKLKTLGKDVRRFCAEQKISFPEEEKEQLMDAMHPKWMKLYWPVRGAIKTLQSMGIAGLLGKVRKQFGRGEKQ